MTEQEYLDELIERYPCLAPMKEQIGHAYEILKEAYESGHKLLIAGNGGSAADSEHIAGELMKGFRKKRTMSKEMAETFWKVDLEAGEELSEKLQGALPAIALCGHPGLSTAFLNDVDGQLIFAQQVYGYGNEGDVLLAISTSGNSANIYYACVTALNLHIHKKEGTLMPPKEGLSVVGCPEHHQIAAQIADQYVTLVKDRENYLPMTPEKYKRIKLVFIGGEGRVIAGQLLKGNDEVIKADVIHQLEEAGFEVDAEEPVLKGKMEEFKKRFDAVLLILSVEGFAQYNVMRVKWNLPIKQPWYMSEVPTIVASLTYPNMLIDVPMARCYANAYMNHPEAVHALIEKLMGRSEFKGAYNDNVFCGRWETRF